MKLSIAWIFDHINADWKKQDINFLITKFNKVVAEIEQSYKVKFDLDSFALCKIKQENKDNFKISIPEWNQKIELKSRNDSKDFIDQTTAYMVYRSENKIRWAQLKDFGSDKEGLIPPLNIKDEDINGNWKRNFEAEDIIIEVDNKSITHRPDMWGHRGFAREIAGILSLDFKPEQEFLEYKEINSFDKSAPSTKTNPISISIESTKNCSRFAGIKFDYTEHKASDPFIVSRLLKIGQRPINGLVDLTNYLTQDWSQPVHAYDAEKIKGKEIIVRFAKNKEKLTILDGTELELTDKDLVIADKEKPLCLAGVMGGLYSGIDANTKTVFFESANFDAATIRRTCMRNGLRTESSMRFEKTLDPNQNIEGIFRFFKLAKAFDIKVKSANEILSVGSIVKPITLNVTHEFLERRSGLELNEYDIDFTLTRLGFKVEKEKIEKQDEYKKQAKFSYKITVPTFRSSKDIQIKEDILEEIVRYYGFERLKLNIPEIKKKPADLSPIFRQRKIKSFLANAAKMIEQQNYALYDEQFMLSAGLANTPIAYQIINPVSQNNKKLVTSLLPGLFKNIKDNYNAYDSINFFELAKIWPACNDQEIAEKRKLSGIFFEKKKGVDFYICKNYITDLLNSIGIKPKQAEWKKSEKLDPWSMQHQTADIYFNKILIGRAGKVDPLFLSKLNVLPESDAFFFDLNADFLINLKPETIRFQEPSKFQETFIDLSLMVPLKVTTKEIESLLSKIDKLVTEVKLIDFFEKKDWINSRSLTFRVYINNPERTLQKEEIENIWNLSIEACGKIGAEIRK